MGMRKKQRRSGGLKEQGSEKVAWAAVSDFDSVGMAVTQAEKSRSE
jgi:cation transport regulator ChaB